MRLLFCAVGLSTCLYPDDLPPSFPTRFETFSCRTFFFFCVGFGFFFPPSEGGGASLITQDVFVPQTFAADASARLERYREGSHTVTQMQKLLDAAREERNHERAQAQARDAEMARQLSDIREQALERIRESTSAAQEVSALKERLHAAEAERNRLRDENEELRADDNERRDLRRRVKTAEEAAGTMRMKAAGYDVTEAKLRAAEADRQNLQAERADAHKRLQEMTEKLLMVTSEKDVLVRHSAHQVGSLGHCAPSVCDPVFFFFPLFFWLGTHFPGRGGCEKCTVFFSAARGDIDTIPTRLNDRIVILVTMTTEAATTTAAADCVYTRAHMPIQSTSFFGGGGEGTVPPGAHRSRAVQRQARDGADEAGPPRHAHRPEGAHLGVA